MNRIYKLVLPGIMAMTLTILPAQADVVVLVNGQLYDVSTVKTAFSADAAQLESQPFWNNEVLAFNFARAVGAQLGSPNFIVDFASGDHLPADPYFAINLNQQSVSSEFETPTPNPPIDFSLSDTSAIETYVVATTVPEAPSRLIDFALATPILIQALAHYKLRRKAATG